MNFLIDTNVLSEPTKPKPSALVLNWLDRVDEDRAFINVVTLAEIRRGVLLMPEGRRREKLLHWLSFELRDRFAGRILPVDETTAERWGDILSETRKRGFAMGVMDGFLAACALANGLVLVTRNTRDFAWLDLELLNPWEER